jgi:hypothetical protein
MKVPCFVESFNARLRDEWLNETLFTSLARARFVLNAWQHDYNLVRPHLKPGGRTPAEKAGEPVRGHAPDRSSASQPIIMNKPVFTPDWW